MSRINIQGTIENIRSKSNVYTPIVEAIVNSIHAIYKKKIENGKIEVNLIRDNSIVFENAKPEVVSIHIRDNGTGFNKDNRESFDTFYSEHKKLDYGGKGFGRFMYVKYFDSVKVESVFLNEDDQVLKTRTFRFGKKFDIIEDEKILPTNAIDSYSIVKLENLRKQNSFDKQLETISRKLLEKLLIFFVNDNEKCPTIVLQEADGTGSIVLNDYLAGLNEIQLFNQDDFTIANPFKEEPLLFKIKVFKIYYPGSQTSKISLAGHNREVTEANLYKYIPEFEDDFYDIDKDGESKKNYMIRSYVTGKYLDDNVALEREGFNFERDEPNMYYPVTQSLIEAKAAEVTKTFFTDDVKTRFEMKSAYVRNYVNNNAPWHKPYLKELDFTTIPYNAKDENIEIELQKIKFKKEQDSKAEIHRILNDPDNPQNDNIAEAISKISEIGKSDLAHYVFNRKIVLDALTNLLKRNDAGKAELEKDVHNLIYTMGATSENKEYEDHNLWLLDERLIFSEFIASDKKLSKKKGGLGEPDLLIFNQRNSFRNGDNDFSNPLTIFEFKRPKRTNYTDSEDPIVQIGNYLKVIRSGKHEMPEGLEPIKVNENTPVYGYIVADITDRITEFATRASLTLSPDKEGYFGFHPGYKMYIEILSFKKLLKDATMRNKIFFKKLQIE